MDRATLLSLSRDDLIGLIEALTARIAELEARLGNPPKTPNNSSLPPSKGQKPNLPDPGRKKPRPGRPGVSRTLAEHPDRIIEATLAACPHCDHALDPADISDVHAYDHVDLPPIRPVVTRINRHRGVCPCCRKPVSAVAPEGFEPGSPFGPGIEALILHLHITQAVSFERLSRLMTEVFGLSISEGAIANILARAQTPLVAAADTIAAAPGFRRVLLRAVAIGKRRPALADSTLVQYRADLDRRLDKLLSGPERKSEAARRLFRAMRRDRDDLFRFVTRRDVPYTNNACERALRPSVIFRKVTNCFRAEWGAAVYAAAASVIATGRLHGLTALQALRAALAGVPITRSG